MSNNTEYQLLDEMFDALFPICRSITGFGIEASIDYLRKFLPLKVERIPSGTNIFDWTTPPQWNFKRARLWCPDNNLICDTDEHNLHIVSYSEPIEKELELEELENHLHSLPDLPDAIPYVTSYYQRTWGFCLPHNQRTQLKSGKYKVLIESSFDENGGVPFAHCQLKGESEREILLTSYLCHPSLANNELSGPLVLVGLYHRIMQWPRRRFSYRFLLNPETIGSLSFLSKYHQHLKQNLESGLILTCMGGETDSLRYKASRHGNSLFDQLARYENKNNAQKLRYMDFCPLSGSDERQYCAPGFNLPMAQVTRSLNIPSTPYHTSLDTKEAMNIEKLVESIDYLENFLKLGEIAGNAVNQAPYGEPQLGKRGLYPNLNSLNQNNNSNDNIIDGRNRLNSILTILSLTDGKHSMLEIAQRLGVPLKNLEQIISDLESHKLLKFNTNEVL